MTGTVEVLEVIRTAVLKGLPYTVYRQPNKSYFDARIQKGMELELVEDYEESGFVMSPFDVSKQAVIFREDNTRHYRAQFISEPQAPEPVSGSVGDPSEDACRQKHVELVSKGIDAVRQGEFTKIVLSRSEFVNLKRIDPLGIFISLAQRYPDAFAYVWFHPKVGLWAGASPETLIRSRGTDFKTMSLAGTQRNNGSTEVTWGSKEIREQQIVTDHIAGALSEFSLVIKDTYTKKAGALLHLCNDIEGKLGPDSSMRELIEKLHPTPAVCGLPKEKALDFIMNHEGYDRSFYTGFLGELNCREHGGDSVIGKATTPRHSNLFVNLRCMQLITKPVPGALIYVGGGITDESNSDLEWQETVDKSNIMKAVLPG